LLALTRLRLLRYGNRIDQPLPCLKLHLLDAE